MTGKILLTYATMSGSTAEVADAIARKIQESGAEVTVRPMTDVTDFSGYDAVILGGPMVVGWHRGAMKFVARHAAALSKVPVACFITSIELTNTGEDAIGGVPLTIDPNLGGPPKNPGKLSFKEKQTCLDAYVSPILKKASGVKPVSIGLFGGKLDYSVLNPLAWLFVRFIIRGKAGDYRNWDAINAWAASVGDQLLSGA
ncbi:MAG: hypothetical protein JW966_04120 [Anaerolineae bacterium]|nr:hypothetical protein [Anaerolineae bacterium]